MAKERKERIIRVRVEFEKRLGAKLREMLPARDKVLIMQYLLEQDENKLAELAESSLPAFITICAQQLVDHELNKFMEVYELFKQEAKECEENSKRGRARNAVANENKQG